MALVQAQSDLSGTGVVGTAVLLTREAIAALGGDGVLTLGDPQFLLVHGFLGDGALTSVSEVAWAANSDLAGDGELQATMISASALDADLAGDGALSPVATMVYASEADLSGQGDVTATALPEDGLAADLLGEGSVGAVLSADYAYSKSFSGSGTLGPYAIVRKPRVPGPAPVKAEEIDPLLRKKPPKELILHPVVTTPGRGR